MSLQAYQQASTWAENPRQMEYRLFAEVTRALIEAAKVDPDPDCRPRGCPGLEPPCLDRT